MEQDLKPLQDALSAIDAATTEAGDAASAIATKISGLLAQIAATAGLNTINPASVADLVTQAQAEAAKLQPIADSLRAMGVVAPPATPTT